MHKRKLDIGIYKYNSQGYCENPDNILNIEGKTIFCRLNIAQCHAGWLIGWAYGLQQPSAGFKGPISSVQLENGVYETKDKAMLDIAEKAACWFIENDISSKELKPLADLLKYYEETFYSSKLKLKSMPKKNDQVEEQSGAMQQPSKVVTMQQPEKTEEQIQQEGDGIIEFLTASIKDDFLHYTYRHIGGPFNGFNHSVGGAGIIDPSLREAFNQLNVHLAVVDDCFKNNHIAFEDIDTMHIHDLALDYQVTGWKIKGSEITLIGSKHITIGTRMDLDPKIQMDNLSSYTWFNQLFTAAETCREQIALYHNGTFTFPEKKEEPKKLEQKSLFDEDLNPGEHKHDPDFDDALPGAPAKGKKGLAGKKVTVKKNAKKTNEGSDENQDDKIK